MPRLLAEIRDTYDADRGERSYAEFSSSSCAVDLLHLDDLGAEKQTDWVLEQLYSLVNERYEAGALDRGHDEPRSRPASSSSRSASAPSRA